MKAVRLRANPAVVYHLDDLAALRDDAVAAPQMAVRLRIDFVDSFRDSPAPDQLPEEGRLWPDHVPVQAAHAADQQNQCGSDGTACVRAPGRVGANRQT